MTIAIVKHSSSSQTKGLLKGLKDKEWIKSKSLLIIKIQMEIFYNHNKLRKYEINMLPVLPTKYRAFSLFKLILDFWLVKKREHLFLINIKTFTKAINDEKSGQELPTKEDDFLPIAQAPGAFDTGLYTSRPGLKGYI